jgi:hypothetical protein
MAEPRAPNQSGKYKPLGLGRFMQAGQDHPGLGDHQPGIALDLADAVHPFQGQHQATRRHRAADKPGIAGDRDDRHAMPCCNLHAGRDLCGRSGAGDGNRLAFVAAHPVAGVAGAVRAGEDIPGTDRGLQVFDQSHCFLPACPARL